MIVARELITTIGTEITLINLDLLKNLRKCVKQQAQVKDTNYNCATGELLSLFCENDTKLTL